MPTINEFEQYDDLLDEIPNFTKMLSYEKTKAIQKICEKKIITSESQLLNMDETIKSKMLIEHYVGDADEQFYDCKYNFLLTGPSGGLSHYWKCVNKKCSDFGKIISDSDK